MRNKLDNFFAGEKVWRILTNFWTLVLIAFLAYNFLSGNRYEYLTPAFSVIYTAVLSLYVGTKEFERWYELNDNRHPGELFVIAWTVLIFCFYAARFLLGPRYEVSPEAVTDYIMVLSIFAITQKSKKLYRKKRGS